MHLYPHLLFHSLTSFLPQSVTHTFTEHIIRFYFSFKKAHTFSIVFPTFTQISHTITALLCCPGINPFSRPFIHPKITFSHPTFHLFNLSLPSSRPHLLSYSHHYTVIHPTLTRCHCPPHTHSEQMHNAQECSGSFCTETLTHFSVTAANRCDFHNSSHWQTETADEGRAACSSTTLVIASQGTERIDHQTV